MMSNAYSAFGRGEFGSVRRRTLAAYFAMCCAVIAVISCYDTFLVFEHRDTIVEMEQNPVCLKLIQMEPNSFSLFLWAKMAGTITVLGVLYFLFRSRFRQSLSVATCIAVFQLGLLTYLTFG